MDLEKAKGSSQALRMEVRSTGAAGVVSLEGELDMATVGHFEDAVVEATRGHPQILVVDLRGLTFMDSEGLKRLLDAKKTCHTIGARLVLVRGGRATRRLFEIAGVEQQFEFVADPAEISPLTDPSATSSRS